VLDEGLPESVDEGASVLMDFERGFRANLGARHGSLLLVRPDGYLALHRLGFDADAFPGWPGWVAPKTGQSERVLG
jgi:hypothetical protein